MKLLRTTNTLSEAKDQPHRYKVRTGGLPTFGNPTEPAVKNFGSAAPAKPIAREVVPQKTDGWVKRLNPFAAQGAPIQRAAVQGELSLDNVKPLRNDLSDADLELVAATRKLEPKPEATRIEGVDVPVVKVAPLWERVRGLLRRVKR